MNWFSPAEAKNEKEDLMVLIVTEQRPDICQPAQWQWRNGQFWRYPNHADGDRCALYYYGDVIKWTYMPNPHD